MNMSANHSITVMFPSHICEAILIPVNMINCTLHFGLSPGTQGEWPFPSEFTVFVVETIKPHAVVVANGTNAGDPLTLCGETIEAVTMKNKIFFLFSLVDILFTDFDSVESNGKDFR